MNTMDVVPGLKGLKKIRIGRDIDEQIKKEKEIEEPLSPMARLFHEPGSNVYIIAVIGWKSQIQPHHFKSTLVPSLLNHPRFSSLQVVDEETGEMKWVKTKVNPDNHVIAPNLEPETPSPDKFVEDYISNLSKTTIDKSKPMWDFHFLNLKTSNAESVGVLRVHHSLADGLSLMSLLLACCRKASDPEAFPVITATKRSGPNGRVGLFFKRIWNTVVGTTMFVLTLLFLRDTNTPLKGSPGVENNPRRFVRRTFSLDDFKLVKEATNTTINDVALGVTQAALSKYLNRRYGTSKQEDGARGTKCNIPSNIRLRATFFMNLRPTVGINALVDMMKEGTKVRWGNEIGYVLLPLDIAIRDDPLAYVRETKYSMNKKKYSFEATFSYLFTKSILSLFGSKAVGILSHKVFFNTTLWFSNVPGPRDEIAFCGHPITYIAPSCYGQPNALMIHVVSYMDKITFMLSVDEETIPDPHQLCDDLEDSLKLIKNVASSFN
ncbi:hypothetical protein LguiB_010770 [Lonicera macranthoides]